VGATNSYFERRGGSPRADMNFAMGANFAGEGPPPGIFGGGGAPMSSLGGYPISNRGGGGAGAAAAAARAAQSRAEVVSDGDEAPSGAGLVHDPVTGESRPSEAQGRVQRLDGSDEGDLWRGMQVCKPPPQAVCSSALISHTMC